MKKHFNIHVFRTNEEFSVFLKVDESNLSKDFDDDEIINLAIDSEKLDKEDAELVAYIEEISEIEYWQATQFLTSWQKTV